MIEQPSKADLVQFLKAFEALSKYEAAQRYTRGYGAFHPDTLPIPGVVSTIAWLKNRVEVKDPTPLECHFVEFINAIQLFKATDRDRAAITQDEAIERVQNDARIATAEGNTIFIIGNGGSAGIASHMAADFCKTAGWRARALNDPCTLTCLANDIGYLNVFAQQIEDHARAGDMLIAISSSGKSLNIRRAVEAAHARNCIVVTLSGFAPDNPLRERGTLNFYVASDKYGIVEVAHHAILHAILDLTSDRSSACTTST